MKNHTMFFALLSSLLLLAACTSQLEAQPISEPESMPIEETPAPTPEPAPAEPTKTAADAIKELQQTPAPAPTVKQGSTLYPPAPGNVTGVDALKARTRSLYSQGASVGTIEGGATSEFPDYTKSSNLPQGYGNENSAGDI
jgi:hypothetical protein